ncbi:hypothetical protein Jden_0140 [Jonesia denitrificans DSM 20603]|uniref:Uncharacterized protein n=2 Tax=Jonesia TaxID=43673 RepID=C7QYG8_JONDD|nr:hypothetical protein Jden_0140 [Jonesia denitrificans DSM 20603]SQH19788.1 Uncharacterised protein [Jonesia denitrificans]
MKAQAYLTVAPEDIAQTASNLLMQEYNIGLEPLLDCGEERVKLVNDEQVDCVITFAEDPTVLDSVVTISEVDGRNYNLHIKVADEPRATE